VGSRALLIFDGDCGFCTRCANFVARRMPTGADVQPWQQVDLAAYGVSEERTQHEVVWVGADGEVAGGIDAVAQVLQDSGGVWAVPGQVLRVPPFRWIGHRLYRLVADNRYRLPGGTCQVPTRE
jgi:predicted DCC family thiol-disulfide oxidoreductase YuxK